jgi:hypothetical protein
MKSEKSAMPGKDGCGLNPFVLKTPVGWVLSQNAWLQQSGDSYNSVMRKATETMLIVLPAAGMRFTVVFADSQEV